MKVLKYVPDVTSVLRSFVRVVVTSSSTDGWLLVVSIISLVDIDSASELVVISSMIVNSRILSTIFDNIYFVYD